MLGLRAALLGGTAAFGTAGAAAYATDEGVSRSATFWWHAFPVYLRYRWVQLLSEDLPSLGAPPWACLDERASAERYQQLHEAFSPGVRDLTYKMRGFYLKNAQYLSTRDDFIPKEYLEWCKLTQDAAPAELPGGAAWEEVRRSYAAAGLDAAEVFAGFEDSPLGVASIGQVHRATLSKAHGGGAVVVKVQAPGIERRFRADLKTCLAFCRLAMPQHVRPLEEVERQFLTEFDYAAEARNLAEVRRNVLGRWGRVVDIPEPRQELCTKEVLVMSELGGVKLADGLREAFAAVAGATGADAGAVESSQRAAVDNRHGAASLKAEAGRARLINAWLRLRDLPGNGARLAWNASPLRPLLGRAEYRWSPALPNLGALLQTLLDVHAWEIFNDGCFNADPHPGNVLLLPDGRLGLIDYGQVKRLPVEARVAYARLVVALCEDDRAEVVRVIRQDFGAKGKHDVDDVTYRLAAFWTDRDTEDVTGGRNLQSFLDWCEAQDPMQKSPDDLVMISRVTVMMRGMGNAFGIRLRVAPLWRKAAEDFLRAQGVDLAAERRARAAAAGLM